MYCVLYRRGIYCDNDNDNKNAHKPREVENISIVSVDDEPRRSEALAQNRGSEGVGGPHAAEHAHAVDVQEHGAPTTLVAQSFAKPVNVRRRQLDGVPAEYEQNIGGVDRHDESAALVDVLGVRGARAIYNNNHTHASTPARTHRAC